MVQVILYGSWYLFGSFVLMNRQAHQNHTSATGKQKNRMTHLPSASAPACLAAEPLNPGRFGVEADDVGLDLIANTMSSESRIAFCWTLDIEASTAFLSWRRLSFSF